MGKNIYVSNKTVVAPGVNIVKVINETVGISESITDINSGNTEIQFYLESLGRTIDWSSAGVWYDGTKGIPAYDNYNTVTGADNTGVNDARSTIQTAINNGQDYKATLLPAGTYYLSTNLSWSSPRVLRGEVDADGKPLTTLVIHGSTSRDVGAVTIGGNIASYPFTQIPLVSGYTKGSYTVTVSSASTISVGMIVGIDQRNDSSFVYLNGGTYCGNYGPTESQGSRLLSETFVVTAKNSNTLTLHRPLYYSYDASLSPTLFIISSSPAKYAGVENIKVEYASGIDSNGFSIRMAHNCWIKNCESSNTPHKHSEVMYGSVNCEVRRCYFHGATQTGGDRGYGTFLYYNCDANLIEDNIYDDVHNAVVSESSCCGNVVAYNYCYATNYGTHTWMMQAFGHHAPHAYMNLWEGNIAEKYGYDFYFGSNSHQTIFRNVANLRNLRYDGTIVQSIEGLNISGWNRYYNVIGNILGHSTISTTWPSPTFTRYKEQLYSQYYPYYNNDHRPTCYVIGDTYSGSIAFDTNVETTSVRHGNYDYVSAATEWEDDIGHDLPDSFYLASKPDFFGSLDWPAIGPDISGYATDIPAKWRYDNSLYWKDVS